VVRVHPISKGPEGRASPRPARRTTKHGRSYFCKSSHCSLATCVIFSATAAPKRYLVAPSPSRGGYFWTPTRLGHAQIAQIAPSQTPAYAQSTLEQPKAGARALARGGQDRPMPVEDSSRDRRKTAFPTSSEPAKGLTVLKPPAGSHSPAPPMESTQTCSPFARGRQVGRGTRTHSE
jgi:hypothetical protein